MDDDLADRNALDFARPSMANFMQINRAGQDCRPSKRPQNIFAVKAQKQDEPQQEQDGLAKLDNDAEGAAMLKKAFDRMTLSYSTGFYGAQFAVRDIKVQRF